MKRSWPDMVFSKSYNFLHGRSLPLAHRLTSLTWRVLPVSSPPSLPCSQRTPSWPRSPGGSSRRPTAFVFSVLLFKWKHWIERHMGAFIICTGNYWLAEIVHLPLYLCMTWYESIPSPYPWFCICIHIHLLEYQIPPRPPRRVFSVCNGSREPRALS